jgi:tetratricopeptide (TPR) repeat protein
MPRRRRNPGWFRKGADPRRHRFTPKECRKGGRTAAKLRAAAPPAPAASTQAPAAPPTYPTQHIAELSESIRRQPRRWRLYSDRAWAYSDAGDQDRALADFTEAIRLRPKDPELYRARGRTCRLAGRFQECVTDCLKAIEISPNHANSINELAWLWATCPSAHFRDGLRAVRYAGQACDLSDWKDAYYLDTLAAAYAECGAFDEAVKWQQKAVELVSRSDKADFRSRVRLYEAGKPYRDGPKTSR